MQFSICKVWYNKESNKNLTFNILLGQNFLVKHPSYKNHSRLNSQYKSLFKFDKVHRMRYKKVTKTNQNTGSIIRSQYCTVKQTSIAVQNIRLYVQVDHEEQGTTGPAQSAVSHPHLHQIHVIFFLIIKSKNAIKIISRKKLPNRGQRRITKIIAVHQSWKLLLKKVPL